MSLAVFASPMNRRFASLAVAQPVKLKKIGVLGFYDGLETKLVENDKAKPKRDEKLKSPRVKIAKKIARDLVDLKAKENKMSAVRVCFNCGESGHEQSDCPFDEPITLQNTMNLFAMNCAGVKLDDDDKEFISPHNLNMIKKHFASKKSHFVKKSQLREHKNDCFKCGQSGHFAKDCTRTLICFKCKQEGHIAKDCKNIA
jgi:hypothetical protein